jgi:hypothetical protein
VELVCFNFPLIPYLWPSPQTPCAGNFANFPPTGDLPNPHGCMVALDSPWRLQECAIQGFTGDPGPLAAETRKEYRDARKYRTLAPFQQVELYAQRGETRDALYVSYPSWWDAAWTSPGILVLGPPVVTYRASYSCGRKREHPKVASGGRYSTRSRSLWCLAGGTRTFANVVLCGAYRNALETE